MQRFLVVSVAAVLVVLSAADIGIHYSTTRARLDEARDQALVRVASDYLAALRAHEADPARWPRPDRPLEEPAQEPGSLLFRLNDEQGSLLLGDPRLQGMVPRESPGVAREQWEGQWDHQWVGSGRYRIASVRDTLMRQGNASRVTLQVAEPAALRDAAHAEVLRGMVLAHALRQAAVLLALWLVTRLALRPLTALSGELTQRRANDHSPLDERRPDELRPLVDILNRLLNAERMSAEQQRRFLADASHQLRTPLAVLRTQLQGLLGGQLAAADTLPKMLQVIDRASGLANQLLSMAKVEQLARRADWVAVDLDAVAREVSLELAPLMARKRLDFSLDSGTLIMHTDPWLLGELVRNLLSNAVHHSKKGGSLGIVIRRHRREAEMVIWDHGGGVDEDVLDRLFLPFNAAKGGTGIGLGLSICRQIGDAMEATVELFNRIEAGRVIGVDAVVRWPRAHD